MQILRMRFNEIRPHLRHVNLLQCNAGFIEGPRKIYDHQFVYVHKGKGRMWIAGQMYDALPGDLFFYGPGVTHAFYGDQEEPYLLTGIHFDFTDHFKALPFPIMPFKLDLYNEEHITEEVGFIDFTGFPVKINLSSNTKIRVLILDMYREFEGGSIYSTEYINGIFHAFLTLVARCVLLEKVDSDSRYEIINTVIQYIKEHFSEKLTNESIAEKFHFNHIYLNQLMVAQTGVPLHQYLIDFRIRKAVDMLIHSPASVTEIARTVGYDDLHYFSRVFKKKTGLTPAQIKTNWQI